MYRLCVFLGYPFEKNGWRLYVDQAQKFDISRHVIFVEEELPYATMLTQISLKDSNFSEKVNFGTVMPIVRRPTEKESKMKGLLGST